MTVNHDVAGSSPARGAKKRVTPSGVTLFYFPLSNINYSVILNIYRIDKQHKLEYNGVVKL